MKQYLIPAIALGSLLMSSCKEDEVAKQKITELEDTILTLQSAKLSLEADVLALKATQGGVDAATAKALTERKDALEKQVQSLLPLEGKIKELTREKEELAAKLAAATMTPSAAAGGAASATGEAAPAGSEISKAVADSFVSIEGDHHSGGGFLAAQDGKVYLYTAASVLSGNQKLTIRTSFGQSLTKFAALELCEGVDIARMQVLDAVEQKMELVAADTELPQSVAALALGMAKGSTVVSTEKANVLGASGEALQLDNSYLQSAPGGPVIHAISGKVLGVMGKVIAPPKGLWQTEEELNATGQPQMVVARLNKTIEWKESKIGTFITESKVLREFDEVTRLALAVASTTLLDGVPQTDAMVSGSSVTVQSVLDQHKDKSMVQALMKWKGDGSGKKLVMSDADMKKKWRGLLSEAQSMAQRGTADLKAPQFSWYHRAWAEASLGERKDVIEDLNEKIAEAK
jgi:outer membrane murein-binding lipoprotein Lpp